MNRNIYHFCHATFPFTAKIHWDVSILCGEIYDLDTIARNTLLYPKRFIELIDDAMNAFDHLCKKNSVTKVDTNHGYLAISGLTK